MKKLITLFSLIFILNSCNKDDNDQPANPLFGTWKVVQERERNPDGITWGNWYATGEQSFLSLNLNNFANITTSNYSYNGTFSFDPVNKVINANFPNASNPDKSYKIVDFATNIMVLENYYIDSGFQYEYVKIN